MIYKTSWGVAPSYDENRPSAKPIIFYPEAHPTEARTRSPFGARFRRMNRFYNVVMQWTQFAMP